MTGFDVGGPPDSILVLHPIHERVDGQPIPDEGESPDGDPGPGWIGQLTGAYRLLSWREYAHRRGVEFVRVNRWPFNHDEDGIGREASLYPPSEGSIDDIATWKAITTILIEHSPDGSDTWCTAYYFEVVTFHPLSGPSPTCFTPPR